MNNKFTHKIQKILIVQTAFIGDVILATSLVEYIRSQHPELQIDFLLRKGNETILETSPHVTNLYIWDKKQGKYKSLFKLIKQIRSEKYDAILNIQRFFNSGFLTALSGAKIKIGFHSNPLSVLFTKKVKHNIPHLADTGPLHEVQRNLQLFACLSDDVFLMPPKSELKTKIYFSEKDINKIKSLAAKDQYIVLAPSSVWFTKQWHQTKWINLIKKLASQYQIYLIGAPADNDYLNSLYDFKDESYDIINLAGKLSLRESALLMRNALRVIVNDSAPLHLASSVNAKTTAIFCSTSPEFGYTPLADNAQTISLHHKLDCIPCGLHGHKSCPKEHFKCAMDIDVKQVTDTI